MKFVTFIHNDDVKCFNMAIQGTHKFVMMGCINFKDHALIKRLCKWKNECDGRDFQGWEKNGVAIESSLRLLHKVVRIFEVLEFVIVWV